MRTQSEIDIETLKSELKEIKAWVKALYIFIVPKRKDYSELSAIVKKLVKEGKPPRKQPKKKIEHYLKERRLS